MSGSKTRYVLDANVFITAKNSYYAFDICSGFWSTLIEKNKSRQVFSIDRIQKELKQQQDDLSDWVAKRCPDAFFKKTEDKAVIDQYRDLVNWVYEQGFRSEAKSQFASVADGWLVAYAKVNGMTVVTHEEFAADAIARVPIPNVCIEFDVSYANTFEMLRDLGVKIDTPRRRKR